MAAFPEFDRIEQAAQAHGLIVMGTLRDGGDSLILLGASAAFWDQLQAAPEALDGAPDPVDRWSSRVISALAAQFGARSEFPFGGPPYAPFIRWAIDSGRAFQSPVGMLVHDSVGMMISYRGALRLPRVIPTPTPHSDSPCPTCTAPCTSACPVGALSGDAPYNLAACHAYLDTPAGQECMVDGCAVRRACPISAGAGRQPAQSAHHMRAFHPS